MAQWIATPDRGAKSEYSSVELKVTSLRNVEIILIEFSFNPQESEVISK